MYIFFERLKEQNAYDTIGGGFNTHIKFQELSFNVIGSKESQKTSPIYQRVRETYEQQKRIIPYQERHTQLCLLMLALANELLEYTAKQFIENPVKLL